MVKYDAILDELREKDIIPQLDTDPASPKAQDTWVLKTGGMTGGGTPYGLLLALTKPGSGGAASYALSYRTKEGTTVRVSLT